MELSECLFSRRSIRNYSDKVVSEEELKSVLEAGMFAPSACNFQAWKFIVIKDEEKRKALKNAIIARAPICILVVYRNDLDVSGRIHSDYVQSASAAIQNMLLMAHEKGLGCCWICDYPKQEAIRETFHIPNNFDTIGCIAMGYPKVGKENSSVNMVYHYGSEEAFNEHKRRFSFNQVVCENVFSHVDGDCMDTKYPKKTLFSNQVKFVKRWKIRIENKLKRVGKQ